MIMKKLIVILAVMFCLTACNVTAKSEVLDILANFNEEIVITDEVNKSDTIEYTAKIPGRKGIEFTVVLDLDTDKISTNYIDKIIENNFDDIKTMVEKYNCNVEYNDGLVFYAKNEADLEKLAVVFVNIDSMLRLNINKTNKITDNLDIQWPIKIGDNTIYFPSLSINNESQLNVTDTFDYIKNQYESIFNK